MSGGIILFKNIRECPGSSGLQPRGGEGWGDLKCYEFGAFFFTLSSNQAWGPFVMAALAQLDQDQGNWFSCLFAGGAA